LLKNIRTKYFIGWQIVALGAFRYAMPWLACGFLTDAARPGVCYGKDHEAVKTAGKGNDRIFAIERRNRGRMRRGTATIWRWRWIIEAIKL
jgi:hypothetical protein